MAQEHTDCIQVMTKLHDYQSEEANESYAFEMQVNTKARRRCAAVAIFFVLLRFYTIHLSCFYYLWFGHAQMKNNVCSFYKWNYEIRIREHITAML